MDKPIVNIKLVWDYNQQALRLEPNDVYTSGFLDGMSESARPARDLVRDFPLLFVSSGEKSTPTDESLKGVAVELVRWFGIRFPYRVNVFRHVPKVFDGRFGDLEMF